MRYMYYRCLFMSCTILFTGYFDNLALFPLIFSSWVNYAIEFIVKSFRYLFLVPLLDVISGIQPERLSMQC